jgi:hypothetical protein
MGKISDLTVGVGADSAVDDLLVFVDTDASDTRSMTCGEFGVAMGTTLGKFLLANGTIALACAWNMASKALTNVNIDSGTIDGVTITGGTIEGTTLGGVTQVVITDADINGGTLDGTVIGGASAAAGGFTTIVTSSTITIPTTVALRWGDAGEYIIGQNAQEYLQFTTGTVNSYLQLGHLIINDTQNTKLTIGITLNQGANDDEILALKSSDVAHGMTDEVETDTYARFTKVVGTTGALNMWGLGEGVYGIQFIGAVTSDDTTKGQGALGPFMFTAYKKSAATVGNMGADANILVVRNNATTVWHVGQSGLLTIGATATTFVALAGCISARNNAASMYTAVLEQDSADGFGVLVRGDMAEGDEPFINCVTGKPATHLASTTFAVMGSGIMHLGYGDDISGGINANMTIGLTINQGTADNEIFSLKSSDVGHGITGQSETDT